MLNILEFVIRYIGSRTQQKKKKRKKSQKGKLIIRIGHLGYKYLGSKLFFVLKPLNSNIATLVNIQYRFPDMQLPCLSFGIIYSILNSWFVTRDFENPQIMT